MREERINRISYLFREYWLKYPELRFNQLIDSLQWEYMNTIDSKYSRIDYDVQYFKNGNKKVTEITETRIP
ncbi:hypothetical protein D7X33_31140, partial [Butyricicoccus sp. 1XD8-22]